MSPALLLLASALQCAAPDERPKPADAAEQAQDAPAVDHPKTASPKDVRSGEEETFPVFALRFTGPQYASLALGVAHGRMTTGIAGQYAQVEPGLGGLKVNAGVFGAVDVAGSSLHLTYLHTWGRPAGTIAGRDYVGPEVSLFGLIFNVSIGALWRIGPDNGAGRWLLSTGIGFSIGP